MAASYFWEENNNNLLAVDYFKQFPIQDRLHTFKHH